MKDVLGVISDKVLVGDGCWQWIGATNEQGYGQLKTRSSASTGAHRVMYELVEGAIPVGLELDHLCGNRGCVRPDHLEPVTRTENVRRSNSPGGINARKTHCKRGHPFDEVNTLRSQGKRYCRACASGYYFAAKARHEFTTQGK